MNDRIEHDVDLCLPITALAGPKSNSTHLIHRERLVLAKVAENSVRERIDLRAVVTITQETGALKTLTVRAVQPRHDLTSQLPNLSIDRGGTQFISGPLTLASRERILQSLQCTVNVLR